MTSQADIDSSSTADSSRAWLRLAVAVGLSTLGGVGMWSFMVALPAIQADFAIGRGEASLPFTLAMIGFACGGVFMGKLADHFGIAVPLLLGTGLLTLGYLAVGLSSSVWQVALAHGLLIGLGCSATFGPLMADTSHWFVRRRGIAVAIAASGNYLATYTVDSPPSPTPPPHSQPCHLLCLYFLSTTLYPHTHSFKQHLFDGSVTPLPRVKFLAHDSLHAR